ncbi:MAG TPA: hypothetical protein VJ673_15475 [Aromatoleum sp.]|uniref:hypothetical protein n=1 Tax=Aromatoleum sp. TaxID=2307007 RepID=UPI002B459676|nr:hypothetical protein [Aromatoleum sp.]HJV27085.1 hypothetical protein [Aromatoleum sp.]
MPTNKTPMSGQEAHEAPVAATPPLSVRSRRGFIGAAAGGAGVFLSVQARTALGAVSCQSPSAAISGNLSAQPASITCTGGNSPTVWKLQDTLSKWPAGTTPPTFNTPLTDSLGCNNGHSILDPASVIDQPGALVDSILPGAISNTSAWAVLAFPANYSGGVLMSHLIAAWLNGGGSFTSYPIQRFQVVEMWNALKATGIYCPSSMSCPGNTGMTESEVIAFITQTYDFTSDLVSVCTIAGTSTNSSGTTTTTGGGGGGKGGKK